MASMPISFHPGLGRSAHPAVPCLPDSFIACSDVSCLPIIPLCWSFSKDSAPLLVPVPPIHPDVSVAERWSVVIGRLAGDGRLVVVGRVRGSVDGWGDPVDDWENCPEAQFFLRVGSLR